MSAPGGLDMFARLVQGSGPGDGRREQGSDANLHVWLNKESAGEANQAVRLTTHTHAPPVQRPARASTGARVGW